MKKRLDILVQDKFSHLSRQRVQSLIMQGRVIVDGRTITKVGTLTSPDADIICNDQEERFVSRAGFKLEKALIHFNIDVTGLTALDAGISTGGFTDCLLQRGVTCVLGIDVGYGQVHEKIRNDTRVRLFERTNLRYLEVVQLPVQWVDLVTLDLSFISVLKVIDVVRGLLATAGKLIVLIKPQFEAERYQVGKGGIIKNDMIHKQVVDKVVAGIVQAGFTFIGVIESPVRGTMGNKEFLAYFNRL